MAQTNPPTGYNLINRGTFLAGPFQGRNIAEFGMKKTPVTNAEWQVGLEILNGDRFVLLEHNWDTGQTNFIRRGTDARSLANGCRDIPYAQLDAGQIVSLGSWILLKMIDNPSARYDTPERIFSGDDQPVVGNTYFHDKFWMALQTFANCGRFRYRLLTDLQYEYVATDKGTKILGTETGTLFGSDGGKLAHLEENDNGRGSTVPVHDLKYEQDLPFDVQTTGNVHRRTELNPDFLCNDPYYQIAYGLRGGSWRSFAEVASGRYYMRPDSCTDDIGLQPVVEAIS